MISYSKVHAMLNAMSMDKIKKLLLDTVFDKEVFPQISLLLNIEG